MALTNIYPSLKDKVVFITGGGSGIGENLVEAFCRQGAKVAFVDILEQESRAVVERMKCTAGCTTPEFYYCNLLDIEQLRSVIDQVKQKLGLIGVLINNAASDFRHDFRDVTVEYWDERINVNLRHAFFAAQAAYHHMKELGGGSIINLGSMSWYECQGNMPGYTSSKAAMEGLTRGLARDMGPDGIRVNALVPGWVMTARQLRDWVDDSTKAEIESSQCLKDPLQPEDVSAMALFLASDDSKLCTAQRYIVDGGWI